MVEPEDDAVIFRHVAGKPDDLPIRLRRLAMPSSTLPAAATTAPGRTRSIASAIHVSFSAMPPAKHQGAIEIAAFGNGLVL